MTTGLRLTDLTVRYGPTTAVDSVSFDLAADTVLALVGPSGCGKSTLLRAVAGLVMPDSGDVAWAGTSITGTPVHRRDVGLMFQDHALFTHRSVAQNIGFGLEMAGLGRDARAERIEELLSLVGLSGFGPRAIEGLSGGEAQRVALARALAPEPKLLLLDEPLASLDRSRRVELNAELGRLLRTLRQTAIYVTHDQDEAFSIADQVGVMDRGRLLRLGSPTEVWRDPQTETVARIVGHETIIQRDDRRFAVRADAVALAAEGDRADLHGTVLRCSFQGDRYELTLHVAGTPWRLFTDEFVAVESSIGLVLDPSKLALLHD